MTIIFTGGGTLGPVTPLVATIEALRKIEPNAKPVWIGTRTGVERVFVTGAGIDYRWIAAGKLRRYLSLRSVLDPFLIVIGFCQALGILSVLKPSAVVTSGAFVAVPVVWAARLLHIPIVLHQEDVEIGIANRISAASAAAITVTFKESADEFAKKNLKSTVIGNPVRHLVAELTDPAVRDRTRNAARVRWYLTGNKPVLVVLGGGTGAQELNDRIARTRDELLAFADVLHLTGKGKKGETKNVPGYVALEFVTDEMAQVLAIADVAVTRAGLGTLSELCTAGVPSVIFPLAGHQEKNAALMEKAGAGLSLVRATTDRQFVDTLKRLVNDRDRRAEMTRACATLFPADAAEKLAETIRKIAK